jgi:hypothetical protein
MFSCLSLVWCNPLECNQIFQDSVLHMRMAVLESRKGIRSAGCLLIRFERRESHPWNATLIAF